MRGLASDIEVDKILKFFIIIHEVMINGEAQIGLDVKIAQLLTIRVISVDNPAHKQKRHFLLQFMVLVKFEGLFFEDSLEEVKEVLAVLGLFLAELETCEDLFGALVADFAEVIVELVEPRE